MSLLKTLQQMLTCVRVPWVPTQLPACRRLVNEIVLGEESDEYNGTALSHFELYRKAMQEAGANVDPIDRFVQAVADGRGIRDALCSAGIPDEAVRFVDSTFAIIRQGKPHIVAAAFTFGREDLIPDMFRSLVSGLSERFPGRLNTFQYYLERHIGVDGDHHGPMALRMVEELCADDEQLWQEATQAAERALSARLELWTAICSRISREREHDSAAHLIAS